MCLPGAFENTYLPSFCSLWRAVQRPTIHDADADADAITVGNVYNATHPRTVCTLRYSADTVSEARHTTTRRSIARLAITEAATPPGADAADAVGGYGYSCVDAVTCRFVS